MFEPGRAVQLSPLVRRITAPNPGPMTGPGTNTYLVGTDEIAVIDPGPAIDSHIDAIFEIGGSAISRIFCTHTHSDHSPAAARLAELTGAELIGAAPPNDRFNDQTFTPTVHVSDGQTFSECDYTIRAVHTPGHVGNHYCFFLEEEGMVFAGDHVMNGSTVVIIPPSGDMKHYIESLQALAQLPLQVIAPAHGDLIQAPLDEINGLIAHRLKRETKVIDTLERIGATTISQMVSAVYDDVDPSLHTWAKLSLEAHLLKLEVEMRVSRSSDERWALIK